MNKSVVITILLIYVASIIIVGFFGISVRVYDSVKYIDSITMDVQATDDSYYKFTDTSPESGAHTYSLVVYFTNAQEGPVEDNDGNTVVTKFISLTLIPKVTYKSGELGAEEKLKYVLPKDAIQKQEEGDFSLSQVGVLTLFKPVSFIIYITPESQSSADAEAQITVVCVNRSKPTQA